MANISSVGYTIAFDQRNNKLNPTRGTFVSLTQDVAGVGGDVNFVRTVAEARAYYPVTEGITLVGRLIGGNIFGFGGQDVRAVDAFFKGGDLVRGFDTSGLGPRDRDTGDALGGTTFAGGYVGIALPASVRPRRAWLQRCCVCRCRHRLRHRLGQRRGPVLVEDDDTIRSSIGASLLWNSPLGPLRADFAYVLTSAAFDEQQFFKFGTSTKF